MKVCQNAPSVSHLLFVEDSLILIRATKGDAKQLQDILDLYEGVSGQMINKAKSAMLFSRNTSVHRSRKGRSVPCCKLCRKQGMNDIWDS